MPSLLLLAVFVGAALSQEPPLSARQPVTSTNQLQLGSKARSKMIGGAAQAAPSLSNDLDDVFFSYYANLKWDGQYAGSAAFWMGLGEGGCGYGNLLNPDKYPFLMAIALSPATRASLGINTGVGCGACVRVTPKKGTKGTRGNAVPFIGVVTDVCPDTGGHSSGKACKSRQVDAYDVVHQLIRDDDNPKVVIKRVACPHPGSNIQLALMGNQGDRQWLKIHFQNVAGRGVIKAVTQMCKSGFVTMKNTYGAVWEAHNQARDPVDCRYQIFDDGGNMVLTKPMTLPKGTQNSIFYVEDTGAQFGSGSGLGGARPPTKTPPRPAPKAPRPPPPAPRASNVPPTIGGNCAALAKAGKCADKTMKKQFNKRCPSEGCCKASCVTRGRKMQ